MITRKLSAAFIIVTLSFLMIGCQNTEKKTDYSSTRGTGQNIYNQYDSVGAGHFINCAAAYQTETGVDTKVWGTSAEDNLRQLMIKYGINQNSNLFYMISGSEPEGLAKYLAEAKPNIIIEILILLIQMLIR